MSAALKQPEPAPLANRVAEALAGPTTSAVLVDLVTETRRALDGIKARYQREEEAILDPLTRAEEAQAARDALERLALDRRRLDAAVIRIEERQKVVRNEEEQARRLAAYDEAKAERDAIAKELAAEYPKLAARLAGLLARSAAADAKCEAVNSARPDGCAWLENVDLVTRGIAPNGLKPSIGQGSYGLLHQGVRLPSWSGDQHDQVWPAPTRYTF